MHPWIHCVVENRTSYELKLVDKGVSGTRNYRWNRLPPDRIPANAVGDMFDAVAEDPIWGNVGIITKYQADIDGFSILLELGGTANDHPAGGRGPHHTVSKDKIINIH